MMKKTAVLSLSLMIILGATGCSFTGANDQIKQEQVQENKAPSLSPAEANEKEGLKTLNAVYELGNSEEGKDIFKDFTDSNLARQDDVVPLLEKHSAFFDKLEEKVTIDEDIITQMKETVPDMSSTDLKKMALLGSTYSLTSFGRDKEGGSLEIYPGSVVEKDGEFILPGASVYKKDKNGGFVDFIEADKVQFNLLDGGKIIKFQEAEGEKFDTNPGILESDLKNAAITMETYLVYAGNTKKDIVVKDDKIVGSLDENTGKEYVLDHEPQVKLKVSGDTYGYKITGTVDGTDLEQVYDSQKGGLQELQGNDAAGGIDYDKKLFSKYKSSIQGTDDVDEAIDSLKIDFSGKDTTFEPIEVDGTTYFKVKDSKSKLASSGELLYLFK